MIIGGPLVYPFVTVMCIHFRNKVIIIIKLVYISNEKTIKFFHPIQIFIYLSNRASKTCGADGKLQILFGQSRISEASYNCYWIKGLYVGVL